MLKPKPEDWLKVCYILFLFLLISMFVIANVRDNERARNKELENESKERLEEIKTHLEDIDKKLKKLETPKKPAPKPAVVRNSYLKTSHIPAMVHNAFGSEYAVAIANCESGFLPEVVYGPRTGLAGERGVMQIHPTHYYSGALARHSFTWADMWIPEKNIAFGLILHKESGWNPWKGSWSCAQQRVV